MTSILAFDAARLWRSHPQELILAGGTALAALAALVGAGLPAAALPAAEAAPGAQPVVPPPLLVRDLAKTDAMAINREIPLVTGSNPAARPFSLGKADSGSRERALECLTSAVYYEAGNESVAGQRAVAQVVLNRVRHPAFPASVCGVVYEGSTRVTGCQFTFTCDGSLARQPNAASWNRSRRVAEAALSGSVFQAVGNATHYHADYVVPYWASSLAKNAVEGAHIFYRWAGGWGRPAAFAQSYAGREPDSGALRLAALRVDRSAKPQAMAIAEIPGAEELPKAEIKAGQPVAVRFQLAARKAVEEAPREPYVEKVRASDNLRWTLTGESPESAAAPLGKPAPSAPVAAAAGAAAITAAAN